MNEKSEVYGVIVPSRAGVVRARKSRARGGGVAYNIVLLGNSFVLTHKRSPCKNYIIG
jgi:hypothetical protein